MEKENYEELEMEIILFDTEDILTESNPDPWGGTT